MLVDAVQHLARRRTGGPAPRPVATASTSSQVSGVDAVGVGWARSEYGATVVFAAAFWLQSMKILPGRRLPGHLRGDRLGHHRRQLLGDLLGVLGDGLGVLLAGDRAAQLHALLPGRLRVRGDAVVGQPVAHQHRHPAAFLKPGGRARVQVDHHQVGVVRRSATAGCAAPATARLATQTSVASSSTTTKSMVSRALVEPGTGSVSRRTQSGVPPGAFFSKKCAPSTPFG